MLLSFLAFDIQNLLAAIVCKIFWRFDKLSVSVPFATSKTEVYI